jgi:hypothetical protein
MIALEEFDPLSGRKIMERNRAALIRRIASGLNDSRHARGAGGHGRSVEDKTID